MRIRSPSWSLPHIVCFFALSLEMAVAYVVHFYVENYYDVGGLGNFPLRFTFATKSKKRSESCKRRQWWWFLPLVPSFADRSIDRPFDWLDSSAHQCCDLLANSVLFFVSLVPSLDCPFSSITLVHVTSQCNGTNQLILPVASIVFEYYVPLFECESTQQVVTITQDPGTLI